VDLSFQLQLPAMVLSQSGASSLRCSLLALGGIAGAILMLVCNGSASWEMSAGAHESPSWQTSLNFAVPPTVGARVQPTSSGAARHAYELPGSSSLSAPLSSLGVSSMFVLAALALRRRLSSSHVALRAAKKWERKWYSIEETRDPTTLPLWQRDYRYGYNVLKRTMVEERKKGNKVFWDVRILESNDDGCKVEMMNSGLIGVCPRNHEGPKGRLQVGDIVKMECTAVPLGRVKKEKKFSPWPKAWVGKEHPKPIFSHWLWLEQQASIKKAKELTAGTIIDGVVHKHIPKGLLITLEGEDEPKGMLEMMDISRVTSSHKYVAKMFPPGTPIKCYVIHADTDNGRITLSTKEFEDDDHVGWMLSFPERCFARAEEAVELYKEKRAAYIRMLQS